MRRAVGAYDPPTLPAMMLPIPEAEGSVAYGTLCYRGVWLPDRERDLPTVTVL